MQMIGELRYSATGLDQALVECRRVRGGKANAVDTVDLGDVANQQCQVSDPTIVGDAAIGIDVLPQKRGYTAAQYLDKIRRLRAVRPDISVSSDFIIGFPGETDADFEATMDLIDAVDDNSFSFIFSPRPESAGPSLPSAG